MTADELANCFSTRWPRPSELSCQQYRHMLRGFGEHFRGRDLESITREEARAWGLENPAAVRFVRAALNDAKRDGLVSQNVFSALRITKPRKERYFPSTEEVQALIRAAEEPLRGRIRFSAYTGLRLGETLAVRPGDFEPLSELSRVEVSEQINAMGERVPRKGTIKSYVACVPSEARRALSNPLLTCSLSVAELWPLTRAEHNKEWNALRKRLKLPENFVWHSLRHHAATWFLDQGASFEDVAIQLGHSDSGQQIRDTYGHMSREKALDRLEAVVGG